MADTITCLVLSVPAPDAELAADALWALGVAGVEERDATGVDPIVELWTSLGDDLEAVTRAAEGFPARWRWRLEQVDARVAHTWRDHATATWIDHDLVVVPEWVELSVPAGTTAITIEPGSSFGLGDHPTTVLSLRALRSAVTPDASVLDVGCGSGVLSIAARMFGASYVRAIDISPAAVSATLHNALANGVAAAIEVDATPIAALGGSFDVIVANLLAPPLIEVADDLRRLLAPGGVLIVSGVLAGRHDHVERALAPLRRVDEAVRDGWAALTLRW